MQLLRKTLTSLYRKKGMMPLKRSDLVFFASMDIRWFTPQQSRRIVRFALDNGLLVADDEDRLVLGFDCTDIKPDLEFKPDVPSLMAELDGTGHEDNETSSEGNRDNTKSDAPPSPPTGIPGPREPDGAQHDPAEQDDLGQDPSEQDGPVRDQTEKGRTEQDNENSAAQNADDEIPKVQSVSEDGSAAEKETPKRQSVAEVSPSPPKQAVSKKVDPGAAGKRMLFQETLGRIEAETDLKKRDIIAQCNDVKKRFGAIDMAAAALVVARKYAIPIDDLLEKAEELLL